MTEQTEGAEVEALAGLLSGAAPEFVHLAIPTHLEQARRLLASDWLAAREAAAEVRGAQAVLAAVEKATFDRNALGWAVDAARAAAAAAGGGGEA